MILPGAMRLARTSTYLAAAMSSATGGVSSTTAARPAPSLAARLADLSKPRAVFVLGGPGAGKGTVCEQLAARYGWRHLSAGQLLRDARASGSADGDTIEECITAGRIVPVAISLGLLRTAMNEACRAGEATRFMIDGFPRNWDNVEGWTEHVGASIPLDGVLHFDAPPDVLLARLLDRGATSGRSDDTAAAAPRRLETFTQSTQPVLDHYRKEGLLITVNGDQARPLVLAETVDLLRPLVHGQIVAHSQLLVDAVAAQAWDVCAALCGGDDKLLEQERAVRPHRASALERPEVLDLGRTAVCSYTRVVDGDGRFDETRVWHEYGGEWKCVSVHTSPALH